MIRELQFRDLERLISFPRDFPFPDLNSGLYCSQKALLSGEKLVGAAMLKLTSEAILILDPEISSRTKARLINAAFSIVPEELKKYGLDQVHVFVIPESDVLYAKMLKEHFGFQDAKGIPLVYTKKD